MATKRDMEELKRSNEELRKSVEFMSHQMEAMSSKHDSLMSMLNDIKDLKRQNEEKDARIEQLEDRLTDLEQYTRMNDVIITGLPTRPRPPSFAAAARAGSSNHVTEHRAREPDSVEDQVVQFLHEKGIRVRMDDIEACHPFPQKDKSKPATIIMRFANRKFKNDLLRQGRQLRGTNVYLNEHLTKSNAEIAKRARYLRKEGKIQSTWSANCKIFIKLNGAPEQAQVRMIRCLKDLEKFA